jgi:hypothetical protein
LYNSNKKGFDLNKVVLKTSNMGKFTLHCPFTNEKLDNDDNTFEIYEGAGNYLFSMCDDCLFFDVGNNEDIEKYWNNSPIEAIEKFVDSYPDKNILIIELSTDEDTYFYAFLNEKDLKLSDEEIEKRFIKR